MSTTKHVLLLNKNLDLPQDPLTILLVQTELIAISVYVSALFSYTKSKGANS